ncbi:hypothetical protein [Candidatus Rhabdochlamydia porcellionis]|jgi:hypothetical protein|uniref:Uncharacterized protein n=1 Tax=Candidatus Rhabdochlamydia porcellionis TaxID=225148 RepID=A0ABX8Z4I2_9BACT|nr:hypothetical protein [Candidatus Rhabdochlamydia porcellionis]QZA59417.1 hypothetical protein RHAB15C_0001304 [Candidatus Rhabdochlamydia porcellionis]
MSPIHSFMPTSNLIIERSQITLKLASKDIEKVVFQEMKKSFQFGKVHELVFIFSVTSKVRIYENLKNPYKKSDIVENGLQHSLNLSSKNVKNAFFEYITRHRSKNGATFVTCTFTLLSTDPIYAELEDNSPKENKESKKNDPPPIPWATHPSRRAISNPLYGMIPQLITREVPQLTKEKSLWKRIRGFLKKYFVIKPLNIPISEIDNIKKRNLSKDSGYESIRSTCSDSDSGYEIPRRVEPAIYLEVLP